MNTKSNYKLHQYSMGGKKFNTTVLNCFVLCFLFLSCNKKENTVNVVALSKSIQVSFALQDIELALGSLYRLKDENFAENANYNTPHFLYQRSSSLS